MNPIYLIIGVAAIYYLPTVLSLASLDLSIATLFPKKIEKDRIILNVGLQYHNRSPFRINIQSLVADVYLGGRKIGSLNQSLSIPVLAKSKYIVGIDVTLDPKNLGDQLWQDAINMNLQNFVFEIRGHVTANNKTFKVNPIWTIRDFVNGK